MSHVNHQGEAVFFVNNGSGSLGILDANLKIRSLLPFERLIIDTLTCDTQGAGDVFVSVPLFGAIMEFSDTSLGSTNNPSMFNGGPSGLSCPIGVVPSVSGTNPFIFGTGRIVNGKTQGVRPSWRDRLNA